MEKSIQSALISVYYKEGLKPIAKKLHNLGITIYSTGGTEKFLKELDIPVIPVENITEYPSILGGRVKTLHPKVFGGILARRNNETDNKELKSYEIPKIDLVIVDLYPFEETVKNANSEQEIIEKIDIGGISLIRAAAKNFKDVICISSRDQYSQLEKLLDSKKGKTTLLDRKYFALQSFHISSNYDTAIFTYFNQDFNQNNLKISEQKHQTLRYGENPHQKGFFFGDLEEIFIKLNGKELSYNNLLDVDAAVTLIQEFENEKPTFAILKHNNACGVAQRDTIYQAYIDALAGDPTSAFGGILIANTTVDEKTATEIHKLFCEVVIAPSYSEKALEILKEKKNRIILQQKQTDQKNQIIRTCLNGYLVQEKDFITDCKKNLTTVTNSTPSDSEIEDLLFASKICKNTKSNTIVLVKNKQLCASGTGQTSRVDALNQAIAKAKHFNFDLKNAVMASDAFFPFPDCVEIADNAGVHAIIQPGGSIKDKLSIAYCDANNLAMVFTNTRHFKH